MRMNRQGTFVAAGLLSAASIGLLWGTTIPLGVPGEWTWPRIAWSPDIAWGWIVSALVAVLYLGMVGWAARRMPRTGRWELSGWLVALIVAGFAWLWCVQESAPVAFGQSKIAWVLYFPNSSGYFSAAHDQVDSVSMFLQGYEQQVATGEDVLHIGTHPPGLILFHRGLLQLCREFPGLSEFLVGTQPEHVAEAFALVAKPPLETSERASIWLAGLITQLAVVLTAIPLFLLVRRDYSRQTAWMAASFWPVIPALAVFLPKSDALFPLVGMSFILAWLQAVRYGSRVCAAVAGLLFFLGMLLSLAFVPVALFAAIAGAWEASFATPDGPSTLRLRRIAWPTLCAGLAFVLAALAMWACFGINLPRVWYWNYLNHSAFYEQFTRTYSKWLSISPIELFLAVGAPVGVLAVAAYAKVIRTRGRGCSNTAPFWAFAIVWGLLWLSGKNSGEAARLWIFLMPWLVWLSAYTLDEPAPQENEPRELKTWLLTLGLQLLVCLLTVTRMSGFHLDPRNIAG